MGAGTNAWGEMTRAASAALFGARKILNICGCKKGVYAEPGSGLDV